MTQSWFYFAHGVRHSYMNVSTNKKTFLSILLEYLFWTISVKTAWYLRYYFKIVICIEYSVIQRKESATFFETHEQYKCELF